MVERYVFVKPAMVDEFMSGIYALGVETDTGFRVEAPSGLIMLHIRGTQEAIDRVKTVPGCAGIVDRFV